VVELRGESFIVSQDQGRPAGFFDQLGHGVGFAGAGDAEQRLMFFAVQKAAEELIDGGGLIAARAVIDAQMKGYGYRIAVGGWLLVVGDWLLVVGDWLLELLFRGFRLGLELTCQALGFGNLAGLEFLGEQIALCNASAVALGSAYVHPLVGLHIVALEAFACSVERT
jgi:hypothetical protein